ncbi:MAG: DUF938 domain-containing protein [Pseudohongiellaceae bacterium]
MRPLPYSQASENNKRPIEDVLRRHSMYPTVLEIGSGTGQHGEYFAIRFPEVRWQMTDVEAHVPDLNRRAEAAGLPNLPAALVLDVTQAEWPCEAHHAIFTANTLHIMPFASVERFFSGVARYLEPQGLLFVYGPFKYRGEFTTSSNAQFDLWLKQRDSRSGIRNFESVDSLARKAGLVLLEDNAMPANNQLLVWRKTVSG